MASAGVFLALAVMVAFILRDVLRHDALPGMESRIVYSAEVYNRTVLAHGQLPHWNPFHFSGTPHFADSENVVLYPPALALRWLPPTAFMQWTVSLHVLLGGAGMMFLTRTVGGGWLAALVAGLALVGGGTVTSWLHHGHVLLLYCAAWLPWALGCAVRSAASGRVLPQAGLVAVMVLQFLAGYVQGSIYIGAVIAAYFMFRIGVPDRESGVARWRPLGQLGVLMLLAGGLAAFQLLPTLQLATEAGRSAGIDYVTASQDAWRFDDLSSLFLPFHGLSGGPVHRYLGDRTAYVGWLPVLMVPFAFTKRPARPVAGFLLLLTVVAVALALGDHLKVYRLHYALFPGFRVPGRVLFVATTGLAVLGALGLEQFIALCRAREWRRLAPPTMAAVTWALFSVAVGLVISTGSNAPMHAWPWIPVAAVATVALIAIFSAMGRARIVPVFVAAFVVLDLGFFSADAVHAAPVPAGEFWTGLTVVRGGRALSTCWMDLGETLESRKATLDGRAGMYLRDYADWAYLLRTGDVPRAGTLVTKINSQDGTLPVRRDLVDLANGTTVVSCAALNQPTLRQVARFRGSYFVYENVSARPRAFWTCGLEELSRTEVVSRLVSARYSPDGDLVASFPISVRWAAGLSVEARTQLETRFQLGSGESNGDTVWRYVVSNPDPQTLLTLAADPAAEDTNGFDRASGRVPRIEPVSDVTHGGDREWLVGTRRCTSRGTVVVVDQDRPDGQVIADVDAPVAGYVYFNEPYYSERRAWVDGSSVDIRKTNLAFSAVEVPAGRHRVELRVVPSSFYAGTGISGLTLVGWLTASWRAHRSIDAGRV
jgi:hypothetical protein